MDKIYELQKQATMLYIEYWNQNVLFSLRWWFLLILAILPWIIWWRLVNRKQILLLLCYGFLTMLLIVFLDDLGGNLGWWVYPFRLVPITERLNSADLSDFPVAYMLLYQYYPKWKGFLAAHVVFAAFISFIAEPFFIALGIYKLVSWRHIYSFPIFILLGVFSKWVIDNLHKTIKQ